MSQKVSNSKNHNVPDWFFNQSAVLPFRTNHHVLEILLITSVRKKRWIIPKGIVEPNLTPQESAIKEAYEEAGISGHILDIGIGEYRYKKWGGVCHVLVYPLRVEKIHNTWPESNLRERCWFEAKDALKKANLNSLAELIDSIEMSILQK
jgi:8-oxo-dGTP pyrophosphatase MutT (NUDIX family)